MGAQESKNLEYYERRGFGRKIVHMGAKAVIANSDSTIECTIVDISDTGAKLELSDVGIITARFKLFVPEIDHIYECEVVWRNGNNIGVRFANSIVL